MPLKIYKGGVNRAGPNLESIREKVTTASAEKMAVATIILGNSVTSKLERNKASRTVLPPWRCPIIMNAAEAAKKMAYLSMDFVSTIISGIA